LNEQARECTYFIDIAEEYTQLVGANKNKNESRKIRPARSLAPTATQASASYKLPAIQLRPATTA